MCNCIMIKENELLVVTDQERNSILEHYNMNEKDLQEKIDLLVDYHLKSGLPEDELLENKARMHICNGKMSTERAKITLKGYYQVRTRFPDLFQALVPGTELYEMSKKYMCAPVLPRLTPDLCRITIVRHNDPKGDAPNAVVYKVTSIMQAEMRFKDQNDFFVSNILIIDMNSFCLKNLLKYTPSINFQLVSLLVSLKLRLKNIHIINHSSLISKVLFVLKTVLPEKFHGKIKAHDSFESLYEYIPKEFLPKDYEGDQPSIQELHDKWCQQMEAEKEYFVKLLNLKCNIGINDRQGYEYIEGGIEGSFKKLNID